MSNAAPMVGDRVIIAGAVSFYERIGTQGIVDDYNCDSRSYEVIFDSDGKGIWFDEKFVKLITKYSWTKL